MKSTKASAWLRRCALAACSAFALLASAASAPQPAYVLPTSRTLIPQVTYDFPLDSYVTPTEPLYNLPRGIEFADFNGDGWLDVVSIPSFPQHGPAIPMAIWLNNRDGTFRDATSELIDGPVPLIWGGTQVIVADFNHDGRPDVFVISSGPEHAGTGYQNSLLLSQPNGKWVDASSSIPNNPLSYNHQGGAGDANGDGNLDVVVNVQSLATEFSKVGIKLLLGDGKGGFSDATARLPLEVRWASSTEWPGTLVDPLYDRQNIIGCATLADVDGDGVAEVITGSYSFNDRNDHGGTRTVRFHKLGADGNYREAARFAIAPAIAGIEFGYVPPPPVFTGLGCSQIVAADFHGTGRPDLLIAWEGEGKRYQQLMRNDGNFQFTDVTLEALGSYNAGFTLEGGTPMGPGHYRASDINGDGVPDIVALLGSTSASSIFPHLGFINDGSGHFTPWVPRVGSAAITASQIAASTQCGTCTFLPLAFDTTNSGVASLVLLDWQSLLTNANPQQSTGLYLTVFAPASKGWRERLFDWAEYRYPGLFAGHATTQPLMGYNVRAYPGGVYLGEKDGQLYVYGPFWGGLAAVGRMSDFISIAAQDGF